MAPCISSFRWDKPYYKVPPDYSREVKFGYDSAATITNSETVLTVEIIKDAIESIKTYPYSSYQLMEKQQKLLNEEYNRMLEKEMINMRPMMQCAPAAQEIRIKERDFNELKGGIFPNGDMYDENAVIRGNIPRKSLPPHKLQLLKYRIKYLRMAHPELENWCIMHDVQGMEVEELYRILKSKI